MKAEPDCEPPPAPAFRVGQSVRVVGPERAWKLGLLGRVVGLSPPSWLESPGRWCGWRVVVEFDPESLDGRVGDLGRWPGRDRSDMEPQWLVGVG